MADGYTTNYNFTLPEISASRDTWGIKHNANFQKLDTALKALQDTKVDKGLVVKAISFVNSDKKRPAFQHTDNAFIELATADRGFPSGAIVMWGGGLTIPDGWAVCDGTKGTPDLRNRFIVGAGRSYQQGEPGGALEHTHGGQTAAVALTIDQMPAHNHQVQDPGHSHGVNDGGHAHGYTIYNGQVQAGSGNFIAPGATTENRSTGVANSNISIAASGSNIGIFHTGGSAAHAHGLQVAAASHLPPYVALLYIMKL